MSTKIILIIILILNIFCASCNSTGKYIADIDIICKNFDKDDSLKKIEFKSGIYDGKTDIIVAQGNVISTKNFKDIRKIEEDNFSDYNYRYEHYYKKNKIIKSLIKITGNHNSENKDLNIITQYYYKKRKCIKKVNEDEQFSNCDVTRKSAELLFVNYPIIPK